MYSSKLKKWRSILKVGDVLMHCKSYNITYTCILQQKIANWKLHGHRQTTFFRLSIYSCTKKFSQQNKLTSFDCTLKPNNRSTLIFEQKKYLIKQDKFSWQFNVEH